MWQEWIFRCLIFSFEICKICHCDLTNLQKGEQINHQCQARLEGGQAAQSEKPDVWPPLSTCAGHADVQQWNDVCETVMYFLFGNFEKVTVHVLHHRGYNSCKNSVYWNWFIKTPVHILYSSWGNLKENLLMTIYEGHNDGVKM